MVFGEKKIKIGRQKMSKYVNGKRVVNFISEEGDRLEITISGGYETELFMTNRIWEFEEFDEYVTRKICDYYCVYKEMPKYIKMPLYYYDWLKENRKDNISCDAEGMAKYHTLRYEYIIPCELQICPSKKPHIEVF